MKKEYKVSGMSCKHCVAAVENAVNQLDGINKVKVNLKKETAVIQFDEEKVSSEKIIQAIVDAGYQAEVV